MPPSGCHAGHADRLAASGYSSAGPPARAAAGLRGDGYRQYVRRHVATIGSQFHYVLADGSQGNGIPQLLPQLVLPWDMPGSSFTLSWDSCGPAARRVLYGDAGGD
jgi:hypothetical protein